MLSVGAEGEATESHERAIQQYIIVVHVVMQKFLWVVFEIINVVVLYQFQASMDHNALCCRDKSVG